MHIAPSRSSHSLAPAIAKRVAVHDTAQVAALAVAAGTFAPMAAYVTYEAATRFMQAGPLDAGALTEMGGATALAAGCIGFLRLSSGARNDAAASAGKTSFDLESRLETVRALSFTVPLAIALGTLSLPLSLSFLAVALTGGALAASSTIRELTKHYTGKRSAGGRQTSEAE